MDPTKHPKLHLATKKPRDYIWLNIGHKNTVQHYGWTSGCHSQEWKRFLGVKNAKLKCLGLLQGTRTHTQYPCVVVHQIIFLFAISIYVCTVSVAVKPSGLMSSLHSGMSFGQFSQEPGGRKSLHSCNFLAQVYCMQSAPCMTQIQPCPNVFGP